MITEPNIFMLELATCDPMIILSGAIAGAIAGLFLMIEDGKIRLWYREKDGTLNIGETDAPIIGAMVGAIVALMGYSLIGSFAAGLIGKVFIVQMKKSAYAFVGKIK